jgi:hypothetical protein
MSRTPNVSTNVPANVPRRLTSPRKASYLVGDPSGWRFQMRLPASIRTADSFLAKSASTLRFRIGPMSRRAAEQQAGLYATICRAVFAAALQKQENRDVQQNNFGSDNLVEQVVTSCEAAIAAAKETPSLALGLARGLDTALKTLNLVFGEVEKGEEGNPSIVVNADAMARDALRSVLAYAPDKAAAEAALTSAQVVAPSGSAIAVAAPTVVSRTGMPFFSEVSQAYIDMRIANDGPDHPDIKYLRLRRQTFLDLIGDRPVDCYSPKDLQDYVSRMKFWPANSTKRAEFTGRTTEQILAANQDMHMQPLALKTLRDGYVANIKTMMRYQMTDKGYRDPFAGVRLRWPGTAAPPVAREEIGIDVINRTFELGVQSGLLDEAMLPLLARLTTRRLGLLVHLRGSDIRMKHGVYVAQTNGIVFDGTTWKRTPIKTAQSNRFFVLHNLLVEIGFVEWAMQQDGWLFEALHEHPDASKYASKAMNRLIQEAGGMGANIEVFHSLRGDGITGLRAGEKDRTNRIQAGHELDGVHDKYGHRNLTAAECQRLANRELDSEINWDVFRGLDFDALAKGRRSRGRKRKA